ncbi:MAG: hypothetical protein QM804_16500 [Propionicimonas sp.]
MRQLAGLLVAGLVGLFGLAGTPASAQPLPAAATCKGVWVVVDYGELGGSSTKCASSYGTGLAALKSAGFSPKSDGGMVLKIGGKPKDPDINEAYWSYWHAELQSDGSYGAWKYSNKGAGGYKPKRGDAEGWRYLKLSDSRQSPGSKPPKPEPEPTAKPQPSKTPKPEPSKAPKPKPSKTPKPKPSTSAKPTDSAKPKPSKSAEPEPSPSPTADEPTPTPTPPPAETPSAEPAPTESAPPDDPDATEPADAEPTPSDPGSGSPVPAIAAAVVVVAGGGGTGLWWWLKGRHR